MCRGCCEYDIIRCKCPLQGTPVGYAVPCCRNAINECDPCIIHPGCSVFENCKRCNNGTWGPRDDFFISGKYCAECRPGWSGGDCMKCGGIIRKRQGHLVLESYPNNARCEWTIQVDRPFTIDLRFMMMSLEFHHSCRYDFVEVRDGDSINSRVIGRLCGSNRPALIQSSGNSLHILFVSDGFKNFDGFFATFQESSACSSSPCLHDGTCILDSSYSYHCACLAGYTGKRCEDVPVERVCALPPKPTHGDHFLVYGPNDVLIALQYLCYQPYELSGTSQRTCLPNNTWSGTRPVCTKVVIKDKGQEEKERKEEQVNGKREGDKVGPNDTKVRTVISEGENTVEIFELEMTKNNTVTSDKSDSKKENNNNTISSADPGRKIIPTRVNNTQYTLYRAGGEENGKPREKPTVEEDKTERKPAEKTNEELDREEEKEKEREVNQSFPEKSCPPLPRLYHGYQQVAPGSEPEAVQFFCNHSYALSGDARRTCQPDGTWSGEQPLCRRACREPKVSELVKQRVLPPRTPSRKTPVLKLYSSILGPQLQYDGPTKSPPVLPQLPPGFHHLYTHIEYECASPFYHHSGSPRRTCLKTGKWSGRHVSCSPVCGKHPTFDRERPAEAHWPWLAAIYRRSTNGIKTKVTKADSLAGSPKKDGRAGTGNHNQASDWQLVCSGALVNQRSVVVAAHCVTELGKVYPLVAAKIKVVVGKHYRDDSRESKGLQHLRAASVVVHPNYDPNILDSDIAVVKLLDKARVGEKVLPLCFSESQREEVSSGHGLVTGWSPLADSSLGADERARVGLVHLADVVPCEQQYARNGVPVSVTENMLCASQKPDYGLSNICPSDTGGVLVLPALSDDTASNNQKASLSFTQVQGAGKGLWRLLGLVSFGYDQGDCDPKLYTVYTRVANFKDWIESNMK
ncbi:putative inactive serine protease PAMR1 [Scophthalmus maximus]|uniref:Inactive serine protease PAMR1 n=1 Tax=Scophthalmus maximus TaxID=52904 RepID=A0A2U9BWT4_SCOMX|nr:putative inactive serine protease PAMR1 [Scophthalmus maximus]